MLERIFPLKKLKKLLLFGFFVCVVFFQSCGEETTPASPSHNELLGLLEAPLTHRIALVSIPEGSFEMGGDSARTGERPVHTVTLDAFRMSACEITNSQYSDYLNAALSAGVISVDTAICSIIGETGIYKGKEYMNLGYPEVTNRKNWIRFDDRSFWVEPGKEKWPVVYVTWYGAYAFAAHYGMRLPTEAEWEYAARGGKQFEYGTGDGTISSAKANFNLDSDHPRAVGCYRPNPFGLYDMAGNVSEWCNDRFGWEYYSSSPGHNPQGPEKGEYRVVRGGSWIDGVFSCRSAFRKYEFPEIWDEDIGFRVVSRP